MDEKIIVNHFDLILNEWIALHDEDIHFPKHKHIPQIHYTAGAQYIHANIAFSKLPKNVKEALVAHEIGHRALHSNESAAQKIFANMIRTALTMEGKVLRKELEADEYGSDLVGHAKYVEALEEIRDLLLAEGMLTTAHEIHMRIEALQVQ